ncbi:MAG TPA: aminoacyl-tRNA hydrolase [Pyrinomonadaceae bacterium]|nr:aminoacyl-tRNA hydrolase [Pyrinomonadaceae bacterium]
MYLIVGLGNPGREYEWSRHNIGFMLIDRLARESGIDVGRRECSSLVGRGEIQGEPVKLVKPQTYMNLSGEAVGCLLRKHGLAEPKDRLVVVSDDLALPLGRIRIRERGSAGGHNGLKSIISLVGTDEFIRLRIGIQPQNPVEDTRRFVLASFSKSDRVAVEEVLAKSAAAIEAILTVGPLKAMAEFN